MTSSSGPWGSYTYTYDQVGNRIRMVLGSTTTVYCYGSFNRLTGYYTTTSCGSPAVSYTYDANGNTVTKTGGWIYSYDYENRLTKVVQSGTTKQQNYYDGDGNRVKQVAGSSTFTYSYQGLNILYDKNVTGSTTTITKHFFAGGLQVAKMVGTGVYYLHQDALGSTRLVTTSTVGIRFSSKYVPYGNNYAMTGKEVFMYAGKPYDAGTGLYYMGTRFYDSTIGRFITQDPSNGTKISPLSQNRYIYALDNPERYVDQNGHDPEQYWGSTPEDFWTWVTTSFFQDYSHQLDVANIAVDIIGDQLQAPVVHLFQSGLTKAAVKVLFSASGFLTGEGSNLVNAVLHHDIVGAIQNGLSVAGDTVKTFLAGLGFWDKLGWVVGVGLNWGADIDSGGDVAAAGDLLNNAALAVDSGKLVYDMFSGYNSYAQSFNSTPQPGQVYVGGGGGGGGNGHVLAC